MAKAEKLKKKIKQLKRKLEQQSSLLDKAKKEVRSLSRELQRQHSGGIQGVTESILVEKKGNAGLAVQHKKDWKKHKFLCERYDVHLDSGHDKDKARAMANKDLVGNYGKEAGFSAEELRGILS